jgi:predicted DNA-binding transcriptional regulator AlpA
MYALSTTADVLVAVGYRVPMSNEKKTLNGSEDLTNEEWSNPATDRMILTAKEVASELRCSKAQVYRLINGGVDGVRPLPSISLGRRKVIQRASFEVWKRANENNRAIVGNESEQNAVGALARRR